MKALADREVWFVTGSQHLYGADVLRVVEDHARRIARALDEAAAIPVRVVAKGTGPCPLRALSRVHGVLHSSVCTRVQPRQGLARQE